MLLVQWIGVYVGLFKGDHVRICIRGPDIRPYRCATCLKIQLVCKQEIIFFQDNRECVKTKLYLSCV